MFVRSLNNWIVRKKLDKYRWWDIVHFFIYITYIKDEILIFCLQFGYFLTILIKLGKIWVFLKRCSYFVVKMGIFWQDLCLFELQVLGNLC